MKQPPTKGWQALMVGALFLGLLVVALVVARRPASSPPSSETATMTVPAVPAPEAVRPEPPLDRAGMLDVARQSASAFGVRAAPPEKVRALVGRRFEMRLPFGCDGPIARSSETRSGWSYNPDTQVLRVNVRSRDWSDAQWLRRLLANAPFSRAEAFPVDRPWLIDATCPAAADPPGDNLQGADGSAGDVMEQPEVIPELALIRLIPADAPRSAASGERTYTAVVKRAPEAVPPDFSFLLVLNGRIASFSDGNPTLCAGNASLSRPHCLVAVQIDRVSFTDETGTELAAWEQ